MIDPIMVDREMRNSFPYQSGAFYGGREELSLGTGLIYDGVRYPLLDVETKRFDTVEGPAVILTHECDIDQSNNRNFNDYLLIAPLIPTMELAESVLIEQKYTENELVDFLISIASDQVYRVMFLPGLGPNLDLGGVIYLNQVCSTHVNCVPKRPRASLSEYGLERLDYKLKNHLFRPKAEKLSKTR